MPPIFQLFTWPMNDWEELGILGKMYSTIHLQREIEGLSEGQDVSHGLKALPWLGNSFT